MTAPLWTRIVTAAVGAAALALSALSFVAPELLFGSDAYHVLTRVATGLLGATTAGIGLAALLAAIQQDVPALRAVLVALFVASALVPPVVVYNIGAFNQADPSGWRAAIVAGGVILLVSVPLLVSLTVTDRVYRAGRAAQAVR